MRRSVFYDGLCLDVGVEASYDGAARARGFECVRSGLDERRKFERIKVSAYYCELSWDLVDVGDDEVFSEIFVEVLRVI